MPLRRYPTAANAAAENQALQRPKVASPVWGAGLARQRLPGSTPRAAAAAEELAGGRGGPRQARIARLLADPEVQVVALDDPTARAVGSLAARSGHHDVVDASVALCAAERGHIVLTSDPNDLAAVNPRLALITL